MKRLRRKFWLQATIASACLFETVGCPQLLSNSIKDGTRGFFETGLTSAILSSLNLEDYFTTLFGL